MEAQERDQKLKSERMDMLKKQKLAKETQKRLTEERKQQRMALKKEMETETSIEWARKLDTKTLKLIGNMKSQTKYDRFIYPIRKL
jgi:hypothetical protein